MKLVFAKEMQSLDQQSAEQIGLPTMVLMENAGKAVAETAADFLEDCFGKKEIEESCETCGKRYDRTCVRTRKNICCCDEYFYYKRMKL